MDATWNTLDPSTTKILFNALAAKLDALSQQGLSNCMWATQAMGFSSYESQHSNFYSDEVRDSFNMAIVRLTDQMTAQSVSTILYSMGKMGFQYSTVPTQTRISLQSVCAREGQFMGAKEVSMALYGLAKMDAVWTVLPMAVRRLLLSAITNHCRQMDEQELGNTVWALSHLGCGIKGESGQALFNTIVKKRDTLKRQSIMAIFQGLGSQTDNLEENLDNSFLDEEEVESKPKSSWADLPPSLRSALLDGVLKLLERPVSEDVFDPASRSTGSAGLKTRDTKLAATTLFWLGKLQARYFDLPSAVRTRLIAHIGVSAATMKSNNAVWTQAEGSTFGEIVRVDTKSSGHVIVLAINGIACMATSWDQVPLSDRRILQSTVVSTLSDYFQSLKQQSLSQTPKQEHSANYESYISPGEVSSLLWSFGRMGLKVESLYASSSPAPSALSPLPLPMPMPVSVREDSSDTMTSTQSAAIDIRLTSESGKQIVKMDGEVTVTPLERDLLLALELTVPAMTGYEVAWSLWGLARIGVTFPKLIANKRPLGTLLLVAIIKHIGDMGEREIGVVLWVRPEQHLFYSIFDLLPSRHDLYTLLNAF